MTDSGVLTCACAGDKIGTITPSHSTIPKRTSLQRRIALVGVSPTSLGAWRSRINSNLYLAGIYQGSVVPSYTMNVAVLWRGRMTCLILSIVKPRSAVAEVRVIAGNELTSARHCPPQ